ncbi:hypothetical protein HFP51_07795 [Parasphingopyxis sp. CP4]|uniref:hypothetical protein n=1 Tax=Parasphingopyxis sp. CP4 TaxID=2724527 RepID=UPI00159FE713|nr:hypothetical protein [Parasphingopyxis sp. CP4]QLC22089.1 hypothetical protein HFP51_07795 [Parasphingopyxis sp. CP4]
MNSMLQQRPLRTVNLHDCQACMDGEVPEAILRTPSMMSPEERRFIYGLAKTEYRGDGLIFDGGAFLGGSTLAFGLGLQENRQYDAIVEKFRQPIVTFERGQTSSNLVRTLNRHGLDVKENESFIPALQSNIEAVADLVELRVGDILDQTWDGPIEIMFLDVVKNMKILNHIFSNFFPHLIEGALVLQQDYFIEGMAPLKLMQEFTAKYFDYVGEVSSMGIFRAKKTVPAEILATNVRKDLDVDTQLTLLAQARDRSADIKRRFMVDISRVRILTFSDRRDEAAELWETLKAEYPEECDDSLKRVNKAFLKTEELVNAD